MGPLNFEFLYRERLKWIAKFAGNNKTSDDLQRNIPVCAGEPDVDKNKTATTATPNLASVSITGFPADFSSTQVGPDSNCSSLAPTERSLRESVS